MSTQDSDSNRFLRELDKRAKNILNEGGVEYNVGIVGYEKDFPTPQT